MASAPTATVRAGAVALLLVLAALQSAPAAALHQVPTTVHHRAPPAGSAPPAASPGEEPLGPGPDADCVSATFADDAVAGRDWPVRVALHVEACGADAVVLAADSLNATALARVFGGTPTDGGVRLPLPADGTLVATFTPAVAGVHTVTVSPVGAGGSDEATVEVAVAELPTAHLDASVYRVERRGVARVGLALDGRRSAVLVLAAERGRPRLELRVRDGGDGRVTVLVDPVRLGVGPPSLAVRATGDDSVRVVDATRWPDPVAPGDYRLSVSVRGVEVSVGVLRLLPAGTTVGSTTADQGSPGGATTIAPGQPGFGPVAALAALAALLARVR